MVEPGVARQLEDQELVEKNVRPKRPTKDTHGPATQSGDFKDSDALFPSKSSLIVEQHVNCQ